MSKLLSLSSDSSSDEDNDVGIKINEKYAQNYNQFREKEVYQKLKDKYGEDGANRKIKQNLEEDDEDSSDDEEEDSDAEELTKEVEMDFFKTLACLKKNDPKIYDSEQKFFREKKQNKEQNKVSFSNHLIYLL